jgi:pimeloyl-ACP methyl ester carboxylesterase
VKAAGRPVVLAVHSGTGFSGYVASDRVPERIAAMVYVDTAPGIPPLDPDFDGAEKPMSWEELSVEENLHGLSEEQLETFRQRAIPEPGGVLRDTVDLTNDARLDIPSTLICTGSQEYKEAMDEGYAWLAGLKEVRNITWADQPLADVVAPGGARRDRGRREGARHRRLIQAAGHHTSLRC